MQKRDTMLFGTFALFKYGLFLQKIQNKKQKRDKENRLTVFFVCLLFCFNNFMLQLKEGMNTNEKKKQYLLHTLKICHFILLMFKSGRGIETYIDLK